MPMEANFQAIAQQFVEFYYNTFDTSRQNLAALYRDHSMLTFESSAIQGSAAIVQKLIDLPMQQIKHKVDTLDAQPSGELGGVVAMVTGALLADEEQRPMSFCQTFQLMPDGAGSFFVLNDIFKLVYPAA